jgi:hypothetical protein
MTDPLLIDSEPTRGQFITELYCWVATYGDGTEGIIAGGIQGLGLTTLVTSRRHVAAMMEETARASMRATMHLPRDKRVVRVRLVTFTSTEGTRN